MATPRESLMRACRAKKKSRPVCRRFPQAPVGDFQTCSLGAMDGSVSAMAADQAGAQQVLMIL